MLNPPLNTAGPITISVCRVRSEMKSRFKNDDEEPIQSLTDLLSIQCILVDSSTVICGTSLFLILGMLGYSHYEILLENG